MTIETTVDASSGATASGSSFYAAMRILPRAQREAMFQIYTFCRYVDDIADSDGPREERLAALQQWRDDIEALYRGQPPERLRDTAVSVKKFGLRREDFLAIIDGMEMDVPADIRAPDDATLDLYCDRVASAVGRLSVRVFGLPEQDGILLAHPAEAVGTGEPPVVSIRVSRSGNSPAPGIGDRVLAKTFPTDEPTGPAYTGRVMKIFEKRTDAVLGIFRVLQDGTLRIEPVERRQPELIVDKEFQNGAKNGDLVEVEPARASRYGLPRAKVLNVLGSLTSEGGPTEWRAMAFWSIIYVIYNLVTNGPDFFGKIGPIPDYVATAPRKFREDLEQIKVDYKTATMNVKGLDRTFVRYFLIPSTTAPLHPLDERQQRGLAEELRVQESLEERWENLVRTVSVEAGDQQYVFRLLKLVIRQAAYEAKVGKLPRMVQALPQQYEQSLDIIARKV